jgi:hypothetical protein
VAWLGTPPWSRRSPTAGRRILQLLARNGSGPRGSGSDSDLSTSSPNQRSPSPSWSRRPTPTVRKPFCLDRLEPPSDTPSSPSSPLQLQILPSSQVPPSQPLFSMHLS